MVVPPLVEQDARWALVQRIGASRQFIKAPQLREILAYICQRAIADPTSAIKEHEIGCNVLGRKHDFNPNEDNIVRVQMSHLRKRLDEYFATEGKDEPIQISIPKGAYVPYFAPRPEPAPPPPPPPPRQVRVTAAAIFGVTTAALAILCVFLAARLFLPSAGSSAVRGDDDRDPFWSRLFTGSQPAAIVVADSCTALLQDLMHSDVLVSEYAGGGFPQNWIRNEKEPGLRQALQLLAERQYTSLADLNVSPKLMDVSRRFGPNQAQVRYARHLNIRDFKTGNSILLGSRRGIPWVRLFEDQLNFTMVEDKKAHDFYFLNRSPQLGEQTSYVPATRGGELTSYADVALVPNLDNNGVVLLVAGLSMVDTEEAGELLTRKDAWKWLAQIVGADVAKGKYFEILLKTKAVAGAANRSQVVTYRLIQPSSPSR